MTHGVKRQIGSHHVLPCSFLSILVDAIITRRNKIYPLVLYLLLERRPMELFLGIFKSSKTEKNMETERTEIHVCPKTFINKPSQLQLHASRMSEFP